MSKILDRNVPDYVSEAMDLFVRKFPQASVIFEHTNGPAFMIHISERDGAIAQMSFAPYYADESGYGIYIYDINIEEVDRAALDLYEVAFAVASGQIYRRMYEIYGLEARSDTTITLSEGKIIQSSKYWLLWRFFSRSVNTRKVEFGSYIPESSDEGVLS